MILRKVQRASGGGALSIYLPAILGRAARGMGRSSVFPNVFHNLQYYCDIFDRRFFVVLLRSADDYWQPTIDDMLAYACVRFSDCI